MEVLREAPQTSSFVHLAEHQSTTPASFHSGPPILHYYSDRCKVIVLEDELQHAPSLSEFATKSSQPTQSDEQDQSEETNGNNAAQMIIEDVDVWVTSEKLLLFASSHEIGLSIPYPHIALHAIQSTPTPSSTELRSQGIYMQLVPSISASDDDDEPPDTVSVTVIPTASATPASTGATANEDDAIESEDQPEQTPALAFFTALSDCSNLHPDLMDEDDEEGGSSRLMQSGLAIPGNSDGSLPPPMPGSGGWITAENMHEFVDENGNFIMDDEEMEDGDEAEQLGPGAGTVRSRAEDDGKDDSDDDSKWQRTS